jgi:hypothetical protein
MFSTGDSNPSQLQEATPLNTSVLEAWSICASRSAGHRFRPWTEADCESTVMS